MSTGVRAWLANGSLVALSVIAVACGAELFLRAFPQVMPLEARLRTGWMHPPQMPTVGDPYIGYLYPPDHHGHVHARDIDFNYSTDAHGFRNRSPWPVCADVVALGDSETFGFGVDDDSTWVRDIGRREPALRLVNLGLPGMAPEEYARIYERYGLGLHPRLVLFGLFPRNDVEDEASFDAWLAAGAKGDYDTWKLFKGTDAGATGTLKSLVQRTSLYWLARVATGRLVSRGSTPPLIFPDDTRIQFAPWYQDRAAEAVRPGDPRMERVLRVVEQARDLATASGAHFLVLLFPTKEDVYLPLRGESVAPMIPPFVAELDSLGVPNLDLTGPMQARARRGERLFFEVDGHPNAAGSRVIANAVLNDVEHNAAAYGITDLRPSRATCSSCSAGEHHGPVRSPGRAATVMP